MVLTASRRLVMAAGISYPAATAHSRRRRIVSAIDGVFGAGHARALDGVTIEVTPPAGDRIAFLAQLESLDVSPGAAAAKVIVNSRTGSVVMNQRVAIQNVAVAHGSLTVTIGADVDVSQPPPLSGGSTVAVRRGTVDIEQKPSVLFKVPAAASLSDVVNALNAIGASPMDLVSILQAMKAAGALRAELEVI